MIWRWFLHWSGTRIGPTGSYWYNFWSGFGSDFGEYVIGVSLITHLSHSYLSHQCHAARCIRIGLHTVDGTHFVTCRRHHPEHNARWGTKAATAEQIADYYREVQAA